MPGSLLGLAARCSSTLFLISFPYRDKDGRARSQPPDLYPETEDSSDWQLPPRPACTSSSASPSA